MDVSWSLNEPIATLTSPQLAARIDISRPQRGMHQLSWLDAQGQRKGIGARLLAPIFDERPDEPYACDSWRRHGDLVVTFTATKSRPARPQVYWRLLGAAELAPGTSKSLIGVGIEAIVSVQTNLLESDPRLTVETELPVQEAMILASGADNFLPVVFGPPRAAAKSVQPSGNVALAADNRPAAKGNEARPAVVRWSRGETACCVLVRLPGDELSYVEMSATADFFGLAIARNDHSITLEHTLFGDQLEKGVILRARIRGALLPRANDEALAIDWFRALEAAPPPLTT